MNRPLTCVAAASMLLSACAKSDSAEADRSPDGASAGAESTPSPASGDKDLSEVSNYRLTMPKVDKFYEAMRNAALAAKDLPEDQRDSFNAADGSLDEYAANLERNAPMRKAIEKAGLSTKEFAVIMMATLQAGMAQGIIAMRPKDDADSLAREMKTNPANVRFMREHKAEIEAKQKAMEAEMKKMEPR